MVVQQSSLFKEVDTFSYERKLALEGHACIAGLDEAGRGPLAGPVVAASVILPPDCDYTQFKDSKKLTPHKRTKLYNVLRQIDARIGTGIASEGEIESCNILQASLLAMKRAVEALPVTPDFLLVDGKFQVPLSISQEALVKGESRSASIAAASIIAKVTRDALMEEYHQKYPEYNFRQHKGYGTAEHRRLIRQYGPCRIHRRTFKGVREYLGGLGE